MVLTGPAGGVGRVQREDGVTQEASNLTSFAKTRSNGGPSIARLSLFAQFYILPFVVSHSLPFISPPRRSGSQYLRGKALVSKTYIYSIREPMKSMMKRMIT